MRAILSQNCTSRTFCPLLLCRRAVPGCWACHCRTGCCGTDRRVLSMWRGPPHRPQTGRIFAGRPGPHWRVPLPYTPSTVTEGMLLVRARVFSQNCSCPLCCCRKSRRADSAAPQVPSERVPAAVSPRWSALQGLSPKHDIADLIPGLPPHHAVSGRLESASESLHAVSVILLPKTPSTSAGRGKGNPWVMRPSCRQARAPAPRRRGEPDSFWGFFFLD